MALFTFFAIRQETTGSNGARIASNNHYAVCRLCTDGLWRDSTLPGATHRCCTLKTISVMTIENIVDNERCTPQLQSFTPPPRSSTQGAPPPPLKRGRLPETGVPESGRHSQDGRSTPRTPCPTAEEVGCAPYSTVVRHWVRTCTKEGTAETGRGGGERSAITQRWFTLSPHGRGTTVRWSQNDAGRGGRCNITKTSLD